MHRSERYPRFLKLIDVDPDKAFSEFYQYTFSRLRHAPPHSMAKLPVEDREDVVHDLVYHCVRNNFKVLRSYRNVGKPFAHWFYILAFNRTMDFYRRRRHSEFCEDSNDSEAGMTHDAVLQDVLRVVRDCINRLSEKCQLYLELAADEFRPREIIIALGLPKDHNIKVSNDLRYCRQKLRECVVDNGYELDDHL